MSERTGPERYFARVAEMLNSPLLDTPGSRRQFLALERAKWIEREQRLHADPKGTDAVAMDYANTIMQLAAMESAQ